MTSEIKGCGSRIDGKCYHPAIIPGIPCSRRCKDDNCPERSEDSEGGA